MAPPGAVPLWIITCRLCREGGRRGSCVAGAAEVAVVTVLGDTALKSRPSNLLTPLLKALQ